MSNRISYSAYDVHGLLLIHHKYSRYSHLEIDMHIRSIAVSRGCPVVDGTITMQVSARERRVEWLDKNNCLNVVRHRRERRIEYVELEVTDAGYQVRVSRGESSERRYTIPTNGLGIVYLMGLFRKWARRDRAKFTPIRGGIGIVMTWEEW